MSGLPLVAVVPVRAGELPAGGDEAVAEAHGNGILIGVGVEEAAAALVGVATDLVVVEAGPFAPARWSTALVELVGDAVVIVPASADGRGLAPRLAHRLNRPLLTSAVAVRSGAARLVRGGGLVLEDVEVDGPFVATFQPGVRGVVREPRLGPPRLLVRLPTGVAANSTAAATTATATATVGVDMAVDPVVVAVDPADPATIDLADAARIVAGGAGLGDAESLDLLRAVGLRLGAAVGATRVVTDRGWLHVDRQIGTTGVAVDPRLYVAFGISGAVQHVAGLGRPDHVVSVNLDPACPMMALADLAIVADAPATLRALADLLGVEP